MGFISPLDTQRFGFPIAKINPTDEEDLSRSMASLEGTGCRLVISKIALESLALIQRMQDLGFRTMDIQSTYAFDLKNLGEQQASVLTDDVVVSSYRPEQRGSISEIAGQSFYGYGHYAASGKLSLATCAELYVDWALRSCDSKEVADVMMVAEIDGQVAGFLGMKIHDSTEGQYASGTLGAVSPEFRGRDVFRILTVHNLLWGKNLGLEWEEHNVLCTNYPVNRSFSGLGFRIVRSFTTMHLWL